MNDEISVINNKAYSKNIDDANANHETNYLLK